MKRLMSTSFVAVLLTASLAWAGDPPAGQADVRVYVANRERQPVDRKGMTAILIVEPAGGQRQTIPLALVAAEGSSKSGLGHGGEVREAGTMFVEVVFEKPHAAAEAGGHDHGAGHGGGGGHGGGHGGGQGEGGGHGAGAKVAHFHAHVNVSRYTCGMKGHPVADAPGRCSKCPMEMRPIDRELTAVVVLRKGSDTTNARGFRYPSEAPTSYADGLERIERHIASMEQLVQANQLTRVHPVAEKVSQVCQQLPQHAPEAQRAQVEATCKATIALFKEIDEAADNNKRPETVAAIEKYKAKLAELRRFAR
jgi:hypothetical protein